MEDNFLHARIEFEESAGKIFYFLLSQMQSGAHMLDRSKDENTFLKVKAQYIATLKERLESLAKETLHKYRNLTEPGRLNRTLTQSIDNFLGEFQRHANELG